MSCLADLDLLGPARFYFLVTFFALVGQLLAIGTLAESLDSLLVLAAGVSESPPNSAVTSTTNRARGHREKHGGQAGRGPCRHHDVDSESK